MEIQATLDMFSKGAVLKRVIKRMEKEVAKQQADCNHEWKHMFSGGRCYASGHETHYTVYICPKCKMTTEAPWRT